MKALPVSPDTARLISIATEVSQSSGTVPPSQQNKSASSVAVSPAVKSVEYSPSNFTDQVLAHLEAKYSPVVSREILSDCVQTTRKECARVAIEAGADKLADYETAPLEGKIGLIAGLEVMVKAIMEGK